MRLLASVVLLGATTLSAGLELQVDQSKGPCKVQPLAEAVHVVCARTAVQGFTLGNVAFEPTTLDGKEAIRFVVPIAKGERVAISQSASGWSILPASASPLKHASHSDSSVAKTPDEPRPTSSAETTGAAVRPQVPLKDASPSGQTPTPAEAATTRASALVARLKDLQLDFSVPESPAFTVLGMTPENVTQPRSGRELAASIKNGIDEHGKVKTGLALEFQPFRLANPEALLKSHVVEALTKSKPGMNTIPQMLGNMSISLGTAKGQDADDKSTHLGLGVRIPIFDHSDGRTDRKLIECYERVDATWLSAVDGKAADEAALKGAEDCYKKRYSARWNASSWIVALGHAWTSDTGTFSDQKASTRGAWTTYATDLDGLLSNSQLLVHVRALDNERVAKQGDPGKFQNQDSRSAGIGFKFGSEAFNASLQGTYQRLKVDGVEGTEKVRRVALGLEYRVAPDIWLVGTIGGEGGRRNGEEKSFIVAGFKFAPSSKPLLSPIARANE